MIALVSNFNKRLGEVSEINSKIENMNKLIRRNEIGLLIILIILAVLFKVNRIEIFFGLEIDFSGIFLVIMLLAFGLKKALLTTIVISLGYIIFLDGEYIQFIDIFNILTLGVLLKGRCKVNVIVGEFIFWLIFSAPIIYSIQVFGGMSQLNEYCYFTVLCIVVNGIFNTFLAEVIYIYFIKVKVFKTKLMIRYKVIILHIVTLSILIPFVANVFTDLGNSYEEICNISEESSNEIYHYILDELEMWSEKSITNLQLSGVIEVGLLEESIMKSSRYKPYNVHIKGRNDRVILDIKNHEKEIRDYEDYEINSITRNLDKLEPISNKHRYFNNSWTDAYLSYSRELDDLGLTVMIEIPTELYNDRMIKEYLTQFKFLMFFALFIAIISMVLNRTIFNSLSRLSIGTKNLPEKLKYDVSINWPSSNISEINLLTNNIENMSFILRENFIELNETKDKLYELAYYDSLTLLPNRLSFKKYLDELVEENLCDNKICVMFMDLNRFKIINDTWGHYIGDSLLSEVSNRLKDLQSDNCKMFRLGGDEFVVVLNVNDDDDIRSIGQEIIDMFKVPFKINELVLNSACSIGASIYPDDGEDIDTIIKYADIAMYTSKENGGNYLQLFNEDIKMKVVEKIAIEDGINEALVNNKFTLVYQPKFSGINENIKSMEALIRWTSSSLGVITPDRFIPIAEESELILKIDEWVILEACRENKKLQSEGYANIPVSVNISARHFANTEILDIVKSALKESGLDPQYLKIEITEGVLIKNVAMVSDIIRRLKDLGVQVSIDDFGKGYSSINQLMTLPINEVKIDRDFIKNIGKDIKKKNVVRLIVELAHSLDLNVVAEGIETNEEKEYLESIGCDELQGYLFSKPIKIDELKIFLNRVGDNDEVK